ncbi:MAG: hypothetical protein ACOX2N_08025 [Peptococcia bacterium]|jgi:hypothetical protein
MVTRDMVRLGGNIRRGEIKQLVKDIDNYLESVRGEDFYLLYNSGSVREKNLKREQKAITECFESRFKDEIDRLCFPEEAQRIEIALAFSSRYWNNLIMHPSISYSESTKEDLRTLREVEEFIGNEKRLKQLDDFEALYQSGDFERYATDLQLKRQSRWMGYSNQKEKNYFNMHNCDAENTRLYEKEMHFVKGSGKYSDLFARRLELMDKVRRTGNLSPEEMKEWANLERNPFDYGKEQIGIVELGRINEDLGIIKGEDADKVFPEYAHVRDQKEKQERKLEALLKKVKEERAMGGSSLETSLDPLERGELRQYEIKQLVKDIDNYLESVRGEDFYLPGNSDSIKRANYYREQVALKECFEWRFRNEIDRLCSIPKELERSFYVSTEYWHLLDVSELKKPRRSELEVGSELLDDLRKVEEFIGNPKRLRKVEALERLYQTKQYEKVVPEQEGSPRSIRGTLKEVDEIRNELKSVEINAREWTYKNDNIQGRSLNEWQSKANTGQARGGNASQERKVPETGRDR